VLTGAQLRGARGLINISVAELAERTGLAVNTIRRAEAGNGAVRMTTDNLMLLINAFDEAGVEFVEAGKRGPGVRLKSPHPLPVHHRRRDQVKK
jgi:transcriptional regulator with XRE-family HTH domain